MQDNTIERAAGIGKPGTATADATRGDTASMIDATDGGESVVALLVGAAGQPGAASWPHRGLDPVRGGAQRQRRQQQRRPGQPSTSALKKNYTLKDLLMLACNCMFSYSYIMGLRHVVSLKQSGGPRTS